MLFKNIYKNLTKTDWQITFAENSPESLISGLPLKLHVMKHNYRDRWFADPFILDIYDSEILLLAECVTDDIQRGRIVLLSVDKKDYSLKEMQYVLDLPTHLSFPIIVRKNGHIYVYPENGEAGTLDLYEFDLKNKSFIFKETIIKRTFGDAVITDVFGGRFLFATEEPDMNGSSLFIYRKNGQFWSLDQEVLFEDNVARMAGDFFSVGGKIYRPAQECNDSYGHGLVIHEVLPPEKTDDRRWHFAEICRFISPLKRYPLCLHTFNSYKDVSVMDVKGYRYALIGKWLCRLKSSLVGQTHLEHKQKK